MNKQDYFKCRHCQAREFKTYPNSDQFRCLKCNKPFYPLRGPMGMQLLASMAHSLGFEWFNQWHHNTADQIWGEETWRDVEKSERD